jgi:hypothetical protein
MVPPKHAGANGGFLVECAQPESYALLLRDGFGRLSLVIHQLLFVIF